MSILCATDLSSGGAVAVGAAAALAVRFKDDLVLVHIVERPAGGVVDENLQWSMKERAEELLRREGTRLHELGVKARHVVEVGKADEAILKAAAEAAPRFVVIAAGRRDAGGIGRTAERVVRGATVPVVVVREEAPFEAWAAGARPLRVLLGADGTRASAAAARWLGDVRKAGPVETVLAHAYVPFAERNRFGLSGPMFSTAPQPDVEALILKDLLAKIGPVAGPGDVRTRLIPGMGPASDHLCRVAREEQADLVLVGTHQRRGLSRFWHGSVAADLLSGCTVAVACVPLAAESGAQPAPLPEYHSVLVATDFSATAAAAVPHAYALLPRGGTVHLITVAEVAEPRVVPNPMYAHYSPGPAATHEQRAKEEEKLAAKLDALAPEEAAERGIETRLEVVEAPTAAEGICQTAERLGVDVIVVGSHGQGGLGRTVMGSVAQAVVRDCRRPVLVVRPPVA